MSSAGRALRPLGCMLFKTCLLTTPKFFSFQKNQPTNNVLLQQIHLSLRLRHPSLHRAQLPVMEGQDGRRLYDRQGI